MNLFNKKIKGINLEKLIEVQVGMALNLIKYSHAVNQTAFTDDETYKL